MEQASTFNELKVVPAARAKAHLLELLSNVDRTREEVIVTKRGKPVAKIVPYLDDEEHDIVGCMRGTFKITGDVVGPEPDVWDAMQ